MKNIAFYNIGLLPEKLILPYNWACLKTYAELDEEIVKEYNWLNPITHGNGIKQIVEDYDISNIDILGLSCFAWNEDELNNVAILVKSINPKCMIVIGGPQPDYSDLDYFKKHPYIDIVVKNEGENAFYQILKEFNSGKNYENVPGIIFPKDTNNMHYDTGVSVMIDNSELSPYLEQQSYFDKLIKDYVPSEDLLNYESMTVPWETTRGCPYNCSYCKWDFSTINQTPNKMRKISIERLKKEIEWFKTIEKHWILMGIDSNFGFFNRDVEIARYICDNLSIYDGYFKFLYISRGRNVKNSNLIQNMFYENKIVRNNPIGVQHTDPDVIKAMDRVPIDIEKIDKSLVPVCHVILGSPEDTFEKWKKTFTDLIECFGEGTEFMVYKYSIFNNTRSSTPEFIKKYNIETINRLPQNYIKIKNDYSKFYFSNKYIVSTNTFTKDDWVKMYLFTVVIHAFFTSSMLTYITQYLKRECGVDHLTFYSSLFNYLYNNENTFLSDKFNECKKCLENYVDNEFTYSSMEIKELGESIRMAKTEEWFLFNMLYYRTECWDDLNNFLREFYGVLSNENYNDRFDDLINYQKNSIVSYDYDFNVGRVFHSKYNWMDYFQNNSNVKLYENEYKIITEKTGTNERLLLWSDLDKFSEITIGSNYNRSNRVILKDIEKNTNRV